MEESPSFDPGWVSKLTYSCENASQQEASHTWFDSIQQQVLPKIYKAADIDDFIKKSKTVLNQLPADNQKWPEGFIIFLRKPKMP